MAGIRTCDRESQVQRPNHYTTGLGHKHYVGWYDNEWGTVSIGAPPGFYLMRDSEHFRVVHSDLTKQDLVGYCVY